MKLNITILLALSAAVITAFQAHAAEPDKNVGHHGVKPVSAEAKPEMIDAEVRKVDKDAKKITLKHGEIKSLDMPAMTMVFQVNDTKLLENIKSGDKVRVSVEQTKSGYAVTNIESAK